MAITSGKLNIIDCYIEIMDFEKQNGLIPTIVQDINTKENLEACQLTRRRIHLGI